MYQALVKAADCIGCTKCLAVCPTDAIIGAAQLLHSVIIEDCIGCERCVPVCPVDCIELVPMPDRYNPQKLSEPLKSQRIAYIRELAQAHQQRQAARQQEALETFERAKQEAQARRDYLTNLFKKTS